MYIFNKLKQPPNISLNESARAVCSKVFHFLMPMTHNVPLYYIRLRINTSLDTLLVGLFRPLLLCLAVLHARGAHAGGMEGNHAHGGVVTLATPTGVKRDSGEGRTQMLSCSMSSLTFARGDAGALV